MRNRVPSLSLYYYTIASAGLLVLLVLAVVKIFAVSHPLRYMFLALLCIGFGPGYLRYQIRAHKKRDPGDGTLRRYALLFFLLLVYLGLRAAVRNFARHEIAGDDYGVAMGFFILGLFLAYYGLYALHLWKNRPGRPDIAAHARRIPRR